MRLRTLSAANIGRLKVGRRYSSNLPHDGKILASCDGPVVCIGLGSIGRGTLPLLDRHIAFDRTRAVALDPLGDKKQFAEEYGFAFQQVGLLPSNYVDVLTPLLKNGGGQGLVVNLSVDTGSADLMRLCHELGALYIDTVAEPWLGFYDRVGVHNAERTNTELRNIILNEKKQSAGGPTAVSCCGANPGMVSWLVKEALLNLNQDMKRGLVTPAPNDRASWAAYMEALGVRGVHIAERDTQRAAGAKPFNAFMNTWSVEGFLSEGMQPAELGWGTHEKWFPPLGHRFEDASQPGIYLEKPGAETKVRTWCPTLGPQYGFLVTHNEAISISDFYTKHDPVTGEATFRPTCHYAYHPCNDAILSLHEAFGAGGLHQPIKHVYDEDEIIDGIDELGVLLYGHSRNAYWYGSRLSIDEARSLAPYNSATGLQVSSAVLAGAVWALENPLEGVVEADEMDHERCLEVQRPYLGPVEGHFTDWNPLTKRLGLFEDDVDTTDPWQFKNILVH